MSSKGADILSMVISAFFNLKCVGARFPIVCERERERETERDRERETDRQTEKDRDRQRQTDRQTARVKKKSKN